MFAPRPEMVAAELTRVCASEFGDNSRQVIIAGHSVNCSAPRTPLPTSSKQGKPPGKFTAAKRQSAKLYLHRNRSKHVLPPHLAPPNTPGVANIVSSFRYSRAYRQTFGCKTRDTWVNEQRHPDARDCNGKFRAPAMTSGCGSLTSLACRART
jgi:hypothetical protein